MIPRRLEDMAPGRQYHLKRDRELFGQEFDEVHRILDQFAHYPKMEFLEQHRKFLHHYEGIQYIRMRFGNDAAAAAEQHVIDDCGHVPNAIEYYNGECNEWGEKARYVPIGFKRIEIPGQPDYPV
jgi:hypothetical protein